MWEALKEWFFGLGPRYGVNPIVFGSIYVGAIPFFALSIAWLIRNLQRGRSIVIPLVTASFCFVSSYLYLIIVGKNIPIWVYIFIAAMITYGVVATVIRVRRAVRIPNA